MVEEGGINTAAYLSTFDKLTKIIVEIETSSDVLRTARAVRLTNRLRKKLRPERLIQDVLDFALLPNSELNARLSAFLAYEENFQNQEEEEDDAAASALPTVAMKFSPELEFYCYFLVLVHLIDQKRFDEAKLVSIDGIARLRGLNMVELVNVSVLASKLYLYYSYSHEILCDLNKMPWSLLKLYEFAVLNHDELGQETLINLQIRNYLDDDQYDKAKKLISKAPRFEPRSNQQLCRHFFYLGKIRTIQVEYSDAKESFLQAAQKAPVAARGFQLQCKKWSVLVHLLLGEIPERKIFSQSGMQEPLGPYFELTNAVRIGDLELFSNVAAENATKFILDSTNNVIARLRPSVIRAGLSNISISYSCISLADVADKLKMHSTNRVVADIESIVAKAIRDRAINATIDHANGWLELKETEDIYSTFKPQAAFSSRIASCLNLHNKAVRALHFPSDKDRPEKKISASQVLYGELLEQLAQDFEKDKHSKK